MKQGWDPAKITDELYKAKFISVPGIISDWTNDYGGISGKDVMDFGCGEAAAALGIALQYKPKSVIGVDIQSEFERCQRLASEQIGLDRLPPNLKLYKVPPGKVHDSRDKYDIIYSWSVFEHIRQPMILDILKVLRDALKPKGVLFIQVAPLYYSAEGSHMHKWVNDPWCHIRWQQNIFYQKLAQFTKDENEAKTLWEQYLSLNRLTAHQLVALVQDAGLSIVREYRTQDEYPLPSELLSIYNEDVLKTNQIVLLLKKNENIA
ncbi:MAG: class I SAM-dependent methyltransferase [Nitrospirota bacterium]